MKTPSKKNEKEVILRIRRGGHDNPKNDPMDINNRDKEYHKPLGPRVNTITPQNPSQTNGEIQKEEPEYKETNATVNNEAQQEENYLTTEWNNIYRVHQQPQRHMTDYLSRIPRNNNKIKKSNEYPTIQPDNLSIIPIQCINEHIPKQNLKLEQWMKVKEKTQDGAPAHTQNKITHSDSYTKM